MTSPWPVLVSTGRRETSAKPHAWSDRLRISRVRLPGSIRPDSTSGSRHPPRPFPCPGITPRPAEPPLPALAPRCCQCRARATGMSFIPDLLPHLVLKLWADLPRSVTPSHAHPWASPPSWGSSAASRWGGGYFCGKKDLCLSLWQHQEPK